jgi:hypothetical protein
VNAKCSEPRNLSDSAFTDLHKTDVCVNNVKKIDVSAQLKRMQIGPLRDLNMWIDWFSHMRPHEPPSEGKVRIHRVVSIGSFGIWQSNSFNSRRKNIRRDACTLFVSVLGNGLSIFPVGVRSHPFIVTGIFEQELLGHLKPAPFLPEVSSLTKARDLDRLPPSKAKPIMLEFNRLKV